VQVVLGDPRRQPGELVILPGRHSDEPDLRTVVVAAPRWRPGGGTRPLAEIYRRAVEVTNQRAARSLVLPGSLTVGPWPIEDVTRVALTVLMSTPITARDITIAVPTPALLERWAEALVREP
jgi:hypothetical protein